MLLFRHEHICPRLRVPRTSALHAYHAGSEAPNGRTGMPATRFEATEPPHSQRAPPRLTFFNQSLPRAALRDVEQVEIRSFVAYLPAMVQRISTIAGWLALAFIAYATLSPIDDRPVIAGAQLEHFAAFAVVGLAFGLANPRRVLLVAAIILISAFGLEALQLLTPDRHARLLDALVKAAGGMCGIGIGQLAEMVLQTQVRRSG